MDDTDIPVLPEFMVLKIDDRIRVTPTAASSSQPALISTDLPARPPAAGLPPFLRHLISLDEANKS